MLERLGEGVEFVRTHAQCAAGAAPCRYRALDFANDTARSGSGETEVGGNRHQGIDGCIRSEEHTSELQSLMRISYAVFCLKKKTTHNCTHTTEKSTSKEKY